MTFHGQSIATGGGSEKPIDQILYERYFRNKKTGIAVECGACDGLYLSTCLFFEELGWTVYNIEASKSNYNKLIINRPKSKNLFIALSNTIGQIVSIDDYGNADNGGANKLSTVKNKFSERFERKQITEAVTSTYKNLFTNPIVFVDLLVLDVEGHELEVLTELGPWPPRVLCIEHVHIGLNKILEVINGYKLDYIDELNAIFIADEE